MRIEPIHALEWNLLLLSLYQVQRPMGDMYRTIRADNHTVGAVEAFPLVAVCQNLVMSLPLDLDDGAQNAGTVDKMTLPVIGISVGVAKRKDFLLPPVSQIDAENLVDFFVADIKKSGGVPDRAFRKSEPRGDGGELRMVIQQLPELRRFGKQFEAPRRRTVCQRTESGHGEQQRSENARYFFHLRGPIFGAYLEIQNS